MDSTGEMCWWTIRTQFYQVQQILSTLWYFEINNLVIYMISIFENSFWSSKYQDALDAGVIHIWSR